MEHNDLLIGPCTFFQTVAVALEHGKNKIKYYNFMDSNGLFWNIGSVHWFLYVLNSSLYVVCLLIGRFLQDVEARCCRSLRCGRSIRTSPGQWTKPALGAIQGHPRETIQQPAGGDPQVQSPILQR